MRKLAATQGHIGATTADTSRGRTVFALTRLLVEFALLLALAAAAALAVMHIRASVLAYRSPVQVQPASSGHPTAPLVGQVVLVVVPGLRPEAMGDMPTLSRLAAQGALAMAPVVQQVGLQSNLATLVTGSPTELNSVSLLDLPQDHIQPLALDTIFAAAQRAGLTTAVVGPSPWAQMLSATPLTDEFFPQGLDSQADDAVAETASRYLRNFRPNLTLIHLAGLGEAPPGVGASTTAYRLAARTIDDHLLSLSADIDLRQSVLVVASCPSGALSAPGGIVGEGSQIACPLVLAGSAVVAGDHGAVRQEDIAPTICALLGAPMPRASSGRVLLEMLSANPAKLAETQVEVALPQRDHAALYLRSIGQGTLSDAAVGDVDIALSSLQVGNIDSAYHLASLATDRIDADAASARRRRIERERRQRLPLAAAAIAGPLLYFLLHRSRKPLAPALAAALTLAALYAPIWAQHQFSTADTMKDTGALLQAILPRISAATGVGGMVLLASLIHRKEGSVVGLVQTSLSYSYLVVYLLASPAVIVYWLQGWRLTWYLPDLHLLTWQVLALARAAAVAALALVLPVALLVAGLLYQLATALLRRLGAAAHGGN